MVLTRGGGLLVEREAGSAAAQSVYVSKRRKKKTHRSVGKYCLVVMVMSLALGPDCLGLNPGSSAF